MSDVTTFVRLGHQPDDAGWISLAGGSEVARGAGLPERPSGPVRVMVPGTLVSHLLARVPARSQRTLLQALPFALEDQVLGEVDDLHFVPGERLADDTLVVTVVAHAWMGRWLERLREAGLDAAAFVPETLLLPREDGVWHLWLAGDLAWLGQPDGVPLAMERENAGLMARIRLEETEARERPGRLVVTRFGDARETDDTLASLAAPALALSWEEDPGDPLAAFARRWVGRPPLDLLTGRYSRRESSSRFWRPWRPALALAGAWTALHLAIAAVDLQRLGYESERLEQRIAEVFDAALPGVVPLDPRRQMASALAARQAGPQGAGGDFVEALGLLTEVFGGGEAASLQSVRFRPGELDLELRVDSLRTLETVRDGMGDEGQWQVEVRSANTVAEGVDARLSVRRASL